MASQTPNDVFADLSDRVRLDLSTPLDRHRGFFFMRRAELLAGDPVTAVLFELPNATQLRTRLIAEHDAVQALVPTMLAAVERTTGTGPLHLDLVDLARSKTTTHLSVVRRRVAAYRRFRRDQVRGLAWRAAAIQQALWAPNDVLQAATLHREALSELVDRRLRTSSACGSSSARPRATTSSRRSRGAAPTGRGSTPFAAARSSDPRSRSRSRRAPSTSSVERRRSRQTDASFRPGAPEWRWAPHHAGLRYNVSTFRLGPHMSGRWVIDPTDARFAQLAPSGGTFSNAVRQLFQPEANWWDRSWLTRDGALAAVQLEALLFARARRSAGGEAELDQFGRASPERVAIGSADVFLSGKPRLMVGDAADAYFERIAVVERDMQVGDQVEVFSHYVHNLVAQYDERGLAGNLPLLIMDVDSDPRRSDRRALRVQCQGSANLAYPDFLQHELARRFDDALQIVREFVEANPTATTLDWLGNAGLLVRWDPYEQFAGASAWWVRLDMSSGSYGSMAEAAAAFANTVADDPNPGPGYQPSPSATSIYFPLYTPMHRDGWTGYFDARRDDVRVRTSLEPFRADGSTFDHDGLFFTRRGAQQIIPVVRPRMIP